MSYGTDSIRNIRTIKAIRGESLTIDLGKILLGDLTAWMKKDPNDTTYRSFNIIGNQFLQLTKTKASDYLDINGVVIEEIKGKWYFDVEQILDPLKPEEVKTIFRGTILFSNDITGSVGVEILDPTTGINTYIGLNDTPNIFGNAGQIPAINATGDMLIWIDAPESTLPNDVVATVPTGGFLIGDTALQGSTLDDFVKQLIAPLVLAIIKLAKSLSSSGISTQTLENGTTFIDTLNYSFSRGLIESKDGSADVPLVGLELSHSFNGVGINVSTGAINTSIVDGSQNWNIDVNHDIGLDTYFDSQGNAGSNLDTSRVAALMNSVSNSITGKNKYWYSVGVVNSSPINSAGVRALANSGFVGNITFNITIPTGDREIAIFLRDTMTLVSVFYVESSNADVTSTFTSSVISVDDAGGNTVGYDKHIAVIGGTGYPALATYKVTINL